MSKQSRIIPVAGVKNFRDMGGYQSTDGRIIKWGHIFRSGHLAEMSNDNSILNHNIQTVIDFRSDAEKVRHPVQWTEGWEPQYRPVPIGGNAAAWVKELYDRLSKTNFPAKELREQFIKAFEMIPIANKAGLKSFFDALLEDNGNNAVLFHCTAGKDRTGIAGALLMKALDVNDEQTMQDFLLTNDAVDLDATSTTMAEWLSAKAGQKIAPSDVLPLVGVEADFLIAAYGSIRTHFGSINAYLEDAMELVPERRKKLQALYLR